MTDRQWLASLRWALNDIKRTRFRSPEPATGAKDTYELVAELEGHLRTRGEKKQLQDNALAKLQSERPSKEVK